MCALRAVIQFFPRVRGVPFTFRRVKRLTGGPPQLFPIAATFSARSEDSWGSRPEGRRLVGLLALKVGDGVTLSGRDHVRCGAAPAGAEAPGSTVTSSQPSSPQLSRIALVVWIISGTVAYSHFFIPSSLAFGALLVKGIVTLCFSRAAPPFPRLRRLSSGRKTRVSASTEVLSREGFLSQLHGLN